MRILNLHLKNTLDGGAEIVFAKGGRLMAARGHRPAWLTIGQLPASIRREDPAYAIPDIADGRGKGALAALARHFFNPQSFQLARRAIREFQPQVVHLHTVFGYRHLSPAALLPFARKGIPIVQTLHDYGLLCPASYLLSQGRVCEACKGGRYRMVAAHRCLDGSRARSAIAAFNAYIKDFLYRYDTLIAAYIAPSHFLRQKFIEFGYPPEKITVIPNAVFTEHNTAQSLPEKRRDYLLFAGRLSHEKGVDCLITAAAGLNFPAKIAGAGEALPALQALARRLGCSNVEFLGFQPHAAMADLYHHAAFTVIPSRWYENGPLVILESFSHGAPVIAARIGALPEFVEDGRTGYTFAVDNPADLRRVIVSALERPAAQRALEQNALRSVQTEHSPEVYGSRLESFLQKFAIQDHRNV